MLDRLTDHLRQGQHLTPDHVRAATEALVEESITPESKAAFLAALATKGETSDEIAAFASELRDRAIRPDLPPLLASGEIVDVCGTGGDRLNTFNISTTVALVLAAAGVVVAKHGNRAITSQSGSADVLEKLGIPIDLTPEQAAQSLRDHGFAFFFAPRYHPSFRHIAPARKLCAERGQRTLFNFLGPLLNPVRPTAQLLGVPRPNLCEPMAQVLRALGARRAMVVSGAVPTPAASAPAYLDEFSTLGETTVAEFYQDRGWSVSQFAPASLPLQPVTLADLAGGNAETNARLIEAILAGTDRGPKRDTVLLNAAAGFWVAGRVKSMTEGWERAAQTLDDGRALRKLRDLRLR
jgi:anthranilate phosphoribosyltransferase